MTDANDILYDKDSASISFAKDGMKIDFGGIAKAILGRIADIYRMRCDERAHQLGGNVQVVGTKTDGSKWRVAVQSPEAEMIISAFSRRPTGQLLLLAAMSGISNRTA